MNWNKEPIKQIPKPIPLPYLKWLVAIFLSIFFLFYTLNIKDDIPQPKKTINIVISLFPLIIVIFSFLYKYISYLNKKSTYDFLYAEKSFADKKWEDWGSRSVGITDCIILLPQKITISYIMKNASEHISSYKIPQDIDYLDNKDPPCYYLLNSIKDTIIELLKIENIKIKYLTTKDKIKVEEELNSSWEKLFQNKKIPEITFLKSLPYKYINTTISNNEDIIEIIIIEQDYTKIQSATLAIFIMTSDDIAKKNNLNIMAEVKRPMLIPLDDDYRNRINTFNEIQVESSLANYIITDKKIPPELTIALLNDENNIKKISPNNFIDLEFFIGPTGEFSSWINMCLTVNLVCHYKNSALSLSDEDNHFYLNTVTPRQ